MLVSKLQSIRCSVPKDIDTPSGKDDGALYTSLSVKFPNSSGRKGHPSG